MLEPCASRWDLLRIMRFEKTRNCLLEFIISRVQALPELGARTRPRAAFRRLVVHDYALQQPLIRAGCKRPAPQRPSTHQAACLAACAREARRQKGLRAQHGEAKI